MARICPVCNSENSDQDDVCAVCGAMLEEPGALLAPRIAPAESDEEEMTSAGTDGSAARAQLPADPALVFAPPEQEQIVEATAPASAAPALNEEAGAPAAGPSASISQVEVPPAAFTSPEPKAEAAADGAPAQPASNIAPPQGELSTAPLIAAPEEVPDGASAATASTLVLPFSEELLQPLPVGALLDGRYVIKSLLQRAAGRNLYRAASRNQQRCQSCGAVRPREDRECPRCGAALTGEAVQGDYLIAESFDRETLVRDPEMHGRSLTHPHLMALVDLLTYTPYGPPRHYSVSEWRHGVPLSELGLPQPAAQVLEWGTQLSAALAYLHQQGVISPGATPDNILIREQEAVLTNLQAARPAPEDPEQRAKEFSSELARLAATLYETMTGRFATVAGAGPLLDDTYPEEVEQLFERALRPRRDAPPLTDPEWGAMLVGARQALDAAGPGMRIRSGRMSDVGRVRELNEDSLAVVECQVMQDSGSASLGVYVVADGMGGHQGGEVASAIAISTVTESLVQQFVAPQFSLEATPPQQDQIRGWVAQAVQQANSRIHQQRTSYRTDMGTTLVALVIAGQRIYVGNVGDSRAYMLAPGKNGDAPEFKQITVDHSLVQRLVSTGQITEDEAKYHPYRNVIYNSLGEKPQVQVDIFSERIQPGTRLLICSDGLSTMLSDEFLAEVLTSRDDPQQACADLVREANNAGGTDNITIITIYLEPA